MVVFPLQLEAALKSETEKFITHTAQKDGTISFDNHISLKLQLVSLL
jgi:hypothetical protein